MSQTTYFDSFPNFDHDPHAALLAEFERLSISRSWKRNGKRYLKEKTLCCREELSALVGGHENKLDALQQLCEEVGISDVPDSITQCRKALSRVAVNILDLIDARRTGTQVRIFRNRATLRNYTMEHRRFFPKKAAKEDGTLKFLLVNIIG